MANPIIDDPQVFSAYAPKVDQLKTEVIQRLIDAASDHIENELGYVVRASDSQSVVIHDGSGIRVGGKERERLFLRQRIDDPGSLTLTENGIALTVATGFTTTADVLVKNAERGILMRLTQPTTQSGAVLVVDRWPASSTFGWALGNQNISVTFTPGWSTVPADLIQACAEIAWFMFRQRTRIGRSSQSNQGGSVTLSNEIPVFAQSVLNKRRRFR